MAQPTPAEAALCGAATGRGLCSGWTTFSLVQLRRPSLTAPRMEAATSLAGGMRLGMREWDLQGTLGLDRALDRPADRDSCPGKPTSSALMPGGCAYSWGDSRAQQTPSTCSS